MTASCLMLVALSASRILWAASAAESISVAEHAARVALTALDELHVLSVALSEKERDEVPNVGALETYSSLDSKMGPFLENALVAVRHLAAAHAAAPQSVGAAAAQLSDMGSLVKQLSELMLVQRKEPLFFWHGPKRMLLSKVAKLQESLGEQVAKLADAAPEALSEADLRQLLGGSPAEEASPRSQSLPDFGVALGDEECGPDAPLGRCNLQDLVSDGSLLGPSHVLLQPGSGAALSNIARALDRISDEKRELFISVMPPPESFDKGPKGLRSSVSQLLLAMGLQRCNLLWLPFAVFKKNVWDSYKTVLDEMIDSKLIEAFGYSDDTVAVDTLKKLLEKKKPAAWLTTQDLLRPVDREAVISAAELGISVVGSSRMPRISFGAASAYLRVLVGTDHAKEVAALHLWSQQRGLAVVAVHAGQHGATLGQVKQRMGRPLSAAQIQFLDVLAMSSRPVTVADEGDDFVATGNPTGLEAALRQGLKEILAQAEIHIAAQSEPGQLLLEPAVRDATLQDLDKQSQQYAENKYVIYKEDFFDNVTWDAIVAETKRLWKSYDLEANCNLDGKNRLGGYVLDHKAPDTSLYRLIYGNEAFRRWVSGVNGEGNMYPSDFPIELREYGPKSAGMGCHEDLQMYAKDKKDCEFAVTVDNESPCEVTYYDVKNTKHTVITKANSVMMVRANAAKHCVSGTRGGSRTILKFIYVGDYRKSKQFWHYTGNECDDRNPNRQMIQARRDRVEL